MNETIKNYNGKRVVLTTCHNVSYSGTVVGQVRINEREGIICELDSKTGVSIFCPNSSINQIIEIPLPEE